MLLILDKIWAFIKKYWKITTAAIAGLFLFLLGYFKAAKKTKVQKKINALKEKDIEIYKEHIEKQADLIDEAIQESEKSKKKIERKRLSKINKATKKAATQKKELENNNEKLDKILLNKHNLRKE